MTPHLNLQDIQGLDSISFWPLAIGWWIVIGLVLISLVTALAIHLRRQNLSRSWQHQVLKELENLEKSLTSQNSQQTATQLSALVRRLAIHRFSREECASLDGDYWLQWLNKNDPSQFNWCQIAKPVMEASFRPNGFAFDTALIQQTLEATRKWVQ